MSAALLDVELSGYKGKVVAVDGLVVALAVDPDELVVDERGLEEEVTVLAETVIA